jgi:hypothetical protein
MTNSQQPVVVFGVSKRGNYPMEARGIEPLTS